MINRILKLIRDTAAATFVAAVVVLYFAAVVALLNWFGFTE